MKSKKLTHTLTYEEWRGKIFSRANKAILAKNVREESNKLKDDRDDLLEALKLAQEALSIFDSGGEVPFKAMLGLLRLIKVVIAQAETKQP